METRLHRIIDLMRYIQSGPRFNAAQLAERYGVARRTIFRDIRLLRACGIPVEYDEANEAYLLATYTAPQVKQKTSEDQLALIVAAVMSSPLMMIAETESKLHAALGSVMSGYTAEARDKATNVANAIAAQKHWQPALQNPSGSSDIWSLLVEAIGQRKQIRIEYKEAGQTIQTLVAPYQIVASQARSRLVGRSTLHRCVREFALAEIHCAEMTTEDFEPPKGLLSRLRKRQNPDSQ